MKHFNIRTTAVTDILYTIDGLVTLHGHNIEQYRRTLMMLAENICPTELDSEKSTAEILKALKREVVEDNFHTMYANDIWLIESEAEEMLEEVQFKSYSELFGNPPAYDNDEISIKNSLRDIAQYLCNLEHYTRVLIDDMTN